MYLSKCLYLIKVSILFRWWKQHVTRWCLSVLIITTGTVTKYICSKTNCQLTTRIFLNQPHMRNKKVQKVAMKLSWTPPMILFSSCLRFPFTTSSGNVILKQCLCFVTGLVTWGQSDTFLEAIAWKWSLCEWQNS